MTIFTAVSMALYIPGGCSRTTGLQEAPAPSLIMMCGLNAYFAYTVVLTMGLQLAAGSGWPSLLRASSSLHCPLTNVREGIFNAIPMTLKSAVSVGIGLFVAFVGLQNAKLIVNSDSTLVTYQHFKARPSPLWAWAPSSHCWAWPSPPSCW